MDNEEFLKRLSELAEWERPQYGVNGAKSVLKGQNRKKVPPIIEEYLDDLEEEQEPQVTGPNQSIGPVITKLKPQQRNCDDCGCVVTNRKVERKLHFTNKPHWREHCVTCNLYKDPRTGKFSLTSKESQMIYQTVTRGEGKYRSKYQKHIKTPQPVYKTVETDTGFVKILVENPEVDK